MKIFLYFVYILLISLIKINCSLHNCFEYSCEECNSTEYGACTKCRDTFTLVDGTCPCSFTSCALCLTGLAGLQICEQCKDGYYNFDKDCYCEVNNCEQCAENGCKKCDSGYYYNETAKLCIKEGEEKLVNCYDTNCAGCFSEERGACESCNEGYYLKKGECFNQIELENGRCPFGYYKNGNYCEQRCSGADCSLRIYSTVYLCPDNECLVCENNELKIFSECDNTKECGLSEGCLNCITNDECLICKQGYYLISGICKKCGEGCSRCANDTYCIYCMSGYELNSERGCNLTYNFDYNVDVYQERKNKLISIYHPEEVIQQETTQNIIITLINETEITINETSELNEIINIPKTLSCDKNCKKCKDNTGVCIECQQNYNLVDNKCNLICSDKKCLSCDLKDGKQICTRCNSGYEIKSDKCELICSIEKCESCYLLGSLLICTKCEDGYVYSGEICRIKCKDNNCNICPGDGTTCTECVSGRKLYNGKCSLSHSECASTYPNCKYCYKEEGCIECDDGYELSNKNCNKKKNYTLFIIIIIIIVAFMAGTVMICYYFRRKNAFMYNNNNNDNDFDQQSDINSNNPQLYNIRNNVDLSGSFRSMLNKDEIAEEFELQKRKDKPKILCMFCKKKLGNYKCDCGCIVCKEHSSLKEIQINGQNYKACYNCEKAVNNVKQIKYNCNICLQMKNSVAHFKCGCAIEVCKNCYIKCKMTNNRCPGCRGAI